MIGIGPVNTAGQAYMLARSLRRSGIPAVSFASKPHPYGFPVDRIDGTGFAASCSHVLSWTGTTFAHPRVAYVYQGSEIRRPSRHRRLEQWSPFTRDGFSAKLEARLRPLRRPAFVATLDLLDYAPGATWLPSIADPASGGPLLARERPRVLFAPTRAFLKGDVPPDAAYDLHRPALLAPDAMLAEIADADVVVDGLVLGGYGVTAIQAMAAGRVVVGHVSERVRRRLPDLPIVEANPDTIVDVLRDLAAHPEPYRAIAERGPAFHARYHDGAYSVAAVAAWLADEMAA